MTIVSDLSPISLTQFFYANGKIVRPARLYFYKPNSEDPYTVHTEPTLGIPYEQPVLTGGSGRVPPIYIGADPYKVVVYDGYGSLIEDISYLPGAIVPAAGSGGGTPTPGTILQTGDMFFGFANAVVGAPSTRTGCVRANGGIIGPPGFNQTPYPGQIERLNADAQALFEFLWAQDTAGNLAVLPNGKGGSSATDWAENKGIRLPDLRGRAIVGLDGMGQAAAGRLTGVMTGGTTLTPGSYGGAATSTMTLAQMPLHNHTVNKSTTGLTINTNVTGVSLQGNSTGLSIQGNTTGLSVQAKVTGVSVTPNTTGASISQPTGHTHQYELTGFPLRQEVRLPADVGPDGLLVVLPVVGPEPFTQTPTSSATANVSFADASHGHGISETAHTHGITEAAHAHAVSETAHTHTVLEPAGGAGHNHTISEGAGHDHTTVAQGSGTAMSTISPFALAVVYIKL